MARDFAVTADACILLDLDERSQPGSVPNFAAIQIDKVVNRDVPPQLDVSCDYAEFPGHELTGKDHFVLAGAFGVAAVSSS
jgi:hypothetical protein